MKALLVAICSFWVLGIAAQTQVDLKTADSLYKAKNWAAAATYYIKALAGSTSRSEQKSLAYNAACCYSLAGQKKTALHWLEKSVKQYGFNKMATITNDADLKNISDERMYKRLVKYLKKHPVATGNPFKSAIITTDINNFWEAYDMAKGKTLPEQTQIYQQYYFDKSSDGLADYTALKIQSTDYFTKRHMALDSFYASIRPTTLQVAGFKPTIQQFFAKLKGIYPKAQFPAMYFVIGCWTSGGTSSDNGLLLGIDQYADGPGVYKQQLSLWQRNNFAKAEDIPVLVSHELIHFIQHIKGDTTLLTGALTEGMADFVAELMTGKICNERQHIWAKGKEYELWKLFEKEMYLNKAANWIANGSQETPDHPADLGYYMGYQICKAYYDTMADKKQAVYDILNIDDTKAFFEKSGFAKKMEAMAL